MTAILSATSLRVLARSAVRSVLPMLTVLALGLGSSGCEDKAIGRVCDVQADGGMNQAVFNPQALECPSRVCVKPARDVTVAKTVDTVALCTAECSKDSDCEDSEKRNDTNPRDKRCRSGFVCGVAFEVGPLCCKKLCICKDFLTIPPSGLQTPATCNAATSVSMCPNIKR
jgi:hypothetical protein